MLKENIYKAQCFGNVEPIEYMVPYPNLRALAMGQCIKFADNILFEKNNITNSVFLKSVNQFANWLKKKRMTKGKKVLLSNIPSPNFDILCYAVWSLGSIVVLTDNEKLNVETIDLLIDSNSANDLDEARFESDDYISSDNVLLNDPAVIFFSKNKGIIISHYNLLINTYGVYKELDILHTQSIMVDIPRDNTAFLVLNTILPLYSGTTIKSNSADITFGRNTDADYIVKFDWKNLKITKPQSLYVLPEATAILAIGNKPNHLIKVDNINDSLFVSGHSVMLGYTNDEINKNIFTDNGMKIEL